MGIGAALNRLLAAPDLDLAELHKAATFGQGIKTRVHPVALEAVEHHIHAAAAGGVQHLIAEVEAAGIEHRLHPLGQQTGLLGCAGGGQHPRTKTQGHLQGRLAHAARGCMDQHRFTRAQLGQVLQAVDGSEEGGADARPEGRIKGRWQRHAQGSAADHVAGQAAHRQGRQQPLTHQGRIHTSTHCQHPAHTFTPVGHAGAGIHAQLTAVARQQPQSIQNIAEVEARGLHRQLQFPRSGGLAPKGQRPQGFQAAQGAALQPEWPIRQGLQPLHPGPAVTPGQQGLPLAQGQQGRPIGRSRRSPIGEMQHRPAQGWLLQGRRAGEARQARGQSTAAHEHQPHRPGRSRGQLLGLLQQLGCQHLQTHAVLGQVGPKQQGFGAGIRRQLQKLCLQRRRLLPVAGQQPILGTRLEILGR